MTDSTDRPEGVTPDRPDLADVAERADLLPEERAAGSADPVEQAEAILEDSEARTEDPDAGITQD